MVLEVGGVDLALSVSEAILCSRFPRDGSQDERRAARLCRLAFVAGWTLTRLEAPNGGSRLMVRMLAGLAGCSDSVVADERFRALAELVGGCTSRSLLALEVECGLQTVEQMLVEVEMELLDMRRTWFAAGPVAVIGRVFDWVRPAAIVAARRDTEERLGR